MKKKSLIVRVAVILTGLVALVAIWLTVTAPCRNAARFLREIAKLEIGKTTLEEFRGQVARAHIASVDFTCELQNCSVSLRTENRLFHKLHLAPLSKLAGGVAFQNQIASDIYLLFVTQGMNDGGVVFDDKGVVVRLTLEQPLACHPHYTAEVKLRNGVGERYWGTVHMDRCVSQEELARAVAFNTGCLIRVGACQSPEAFLPQVFGSPQ